MFLTERKKSVILQYFSYFLVLSVSLKPVLPTRNIVLIMINEQTIKKRMIAQTKYGD